MAQKPYDVNLDGLENDSTIGFLPVDAFGESCPLHMAVSTSVTERPLPNLTGLSQHCTINSGIVLGQISLTVQMSRKDSMRPD